MEPKRFITAFTGARHLSLSWGTSTPEYYPPIYAWVFQVASFPQVSPPKPCIRHPQALADHTYV